MADLYPVYKDIGGVRMKMTAYKDIEGVRTKISSVGETYAITYIYDNTLYSIDNPLETIVQGETVSFVVSSFEPATITATNADIEVTNKSFRYTCVLSNPTGDVTVTISQLSIGPPAPELL